MESNSYKDFETAFSRALDKHAPEKKKSVRANSKPYVSKAMQVAIMKDQNYLVDIEKILLTLIV